MTGARPLLAPLDPTDHLSESDRAARREAEFLATALSNHQARAAAAGGATQPGVCTNCDAPCSPFAVYCDADCRADHEARTAAHARQARA